jgi:hypothetical protein
LEKDQECKLGEHQEHKLGRVARMWLGRWANEIHTQLFKKKGT